MSQRVATAVLGRHRAATQDLAQTARATHPLTVCLHRPQPPRRGYTRWARHVGLGATTACHSQEGFLIVSKRMPIGIGTQCHHFRPKKSHCVQWLFLHALAYEAAAAGFFLRTSFSLMRADLPLR